MRKQQILRMLRSNTRMHMYGDMRVLAAGLAICHRPFYMWSGPATVGHACNTIWRTVWASHQDGINSETNLRGVLHRRFYTEKGLSHETEAQIIITAVEARTAPGG